jgi:hypothetical protein
MVSIEFENENVSSDESIGMGGGFLPSFHAYPWRRIK